MSKHLTMKHLLTALVLTTVGTTSVYAGDFLSEMSRTLQQTRRVVREAHGMKRDLDRLAPSEPTHNRPVPRPDPSLSGTTPPREDTEPSAQGNEIPAPVLFGLMSMFLGGGEPNAPASGGTDQIDQWNRRRAEQENQAREDARRARESAEATRLQRNCYTGCAW